MQEFNGSIWGLAKKAETVIPHISYKGRKHLVLGGKTCITMYEYLYVQKIVYKSSRVDVLLVFCN